MMKHLQARTALEANKALIFHVFSENAEKPNLTERWGIADKNGEDFMKAHGYSVLSRTLEAYLSGTYTYHKYLHTRVASQQDGVSTMSAEDCACLKAIVSAKSNTAKHVMVLRAVRRKILSPEVIQFACGAKPAVRPLGNTLTVKNENNMPSKNDGVDVMLVEKKQPEKVVQPRSKKRRRKAEPEEAPAEPVDNST